jgi:5-methyltetrahydropteroyltriglutamate--homocysteine methyltransferase
VLGLVSSKIDQLETADEIERRIEQASRCSPLEQLSLSPQCGFSTSATDNVGVSEGMERDKLARIVEVARRLWGEA